MHDAGQFEKTLATYVAYVEKRTPESIINSLIRTYQKSVKNSLSGLEEQVYDEKDSKELEGMMFEYAKDMLKATESLRDVDDSIVKKQFALTSGYRTYNEAIYSILVSDPSSDVEFSFRKLHNRIKEMIKSTHFSYKEVIGGSTYSLHNGETLLRNLAVSSYFSRLKQECKKLDIENVDRQLDVSGILMLLESYYKEDSSYGLFGLNKDSALRIKLSKLQSNILDVNGRPMSAEKLEQTGKIYVPGEFHVVGQSVTSPSKSGDIEDEIENFSDLLNGMVNP